MFDLLARHCSLAVFLDVSSGTVLLAYDMQFFFSARLHKVHRTIVVTSVVRVCVYVRVRVSVTLSVKVFYKSISLDHVDGSS